MKVRKEDRKKKMRKRNVETKIAFYRFVTKLQRGDTKLSRN